jgi:hypothetical protein
VIVAALLVQAPGAEMPTPVAWRPLVSAAFLIGVSACLSGTEPAVICGTFDGRVTGVADDTVSGCAVFSINPAGEFGLLLTNGGPSDVKPAIKLLRAQGRPVPATFQIDACPGAPASFCGVAVYAGQTFTLSGTVVFTEADTMNVRGSITATATAPAGAVLNISGSFVAPCIGGAHDPFATPGDQPGTARKPTPCKPGTGSG